MIAPPSSLKVSVVREGWIVRDGATVVEACSTITLIESGNARILVDTGSLEEEEGLRSELNSLGILPNSVTHVINTHLHMDHCGCNEMFPGAVFHAHPAEDPPIGTVATSSEMTLLPGVRVIPTPGHTNGSVSVFVGSDRRYAICGDAIPTRANYEAHVPPAIHVDRDIALKSMDAILGWAELIIPGHDRPFEVMGNK